jgi:hypothetical protein
LVLWFLSTSVDRAHGFFSTARVTPCNAGHRRGAGTRGGYRGGSDSDESDCCLHLQLGYRAAIMSPTHSFDLGEFMSAGGSRMRPSRAREVGRAHSYRGCLPRSAQQWMQADSNAHTRARQTVVSRRRSRASRC